MNKPTVEELEKLKADAKASPHIFREYMQPLVELCDAYMALAQEHVLTCERFAKEKDALEGEVAKLRLGLAKKVALITTALDENRRNWKHP